MASASKAKTVLEEFLRICFTDTDWTWLSQLLGHDASIHSSLDFKVVQDHVSKVLNTLLPISRKYKLSNVILWIVEEKFNDMFLMLIQNWKSSDDATRKLKAEEIAKVFSIPQTETDALFGFALLEMLHRHVEIERAKLMTASFASLSFLSPPSVTAPSTLSETKEADTKSESISQDVIPPGESTTSTRNENKSDDEFSFVSETYEVEKEIEDDIQPQPESFVLTSLHHQDISKQPQDVRDESHKDSNQQKPFVSEQPQEVPTQEIGEQGEVSIQTPKVTENPEGKELLGKTQNTIERAHDGSMTKQLHETTKQSLDGNKHSQELSTEPQVVPKQAQHKVNNTNPHYEVKFMVAVPAQLKQADIPHDQSLSESIVVISQPEEDCKNDGNNNALEEDKKDNEKASEEEANGPSGMKEQLEKSQKATKQTEDGTTMKQSIETAKQSLDGHQHSKELSMEPQQVDTAQQEQQSVTHTDPHEEVINSSLTTVPAQYQQEDIPQDQSLSESIVVISEHGEDCKNDGNNNALEEGKTTNTITDKSSPITDNEKTPKEDVNGHRIRSVDSQTQKEYEDDSFVHLSETDLNDDAKPTSAQEHQQTKPKADTDVIKVLPICKTVTKHATVKQIKLLNVQKSFPADPPAVTELPINKTVTKQSPVKEIKLLTSQKSLKESTTPEPNNESGGESSLSNAEPAETTSSSKQRRGKKTVNKKKDKKKMKREIKRQQIKRLDPPKHSQPNKETTEKQSSLESVDKSEDESDEYHSAEEGGADLYAGKEEFESKKSPDGLPAKKHTENRISKNNIKIESGDRRISKDADFFTIHLSVKFPPNKYLEQDAQMHVYWKKDNAIFPLHKDIENNTYTFEFDIPTNTRHKSFEYKYLYLVNDNCYWEQFNFTRDGYTNHHLHITDKQIEDGHVYQFDASFFTTSSVGESFIAETMISMAKEIMQIEKSDLENLKFKLTDWLTIIMKGWRATHYYGILKLPFQSITTKLADWLHTSDFCEQPSLKIYFITVLLKLMSEEKERPTGKLIFVMSNSLDLNDIKQDPALFYADLKQLFCGRFSLYDCQTGLLYLITNLSRAADCYLKIMPLFWLLKGKGSAIAFNENYTSLREASHLPELSKFYGWQNPWDDKRTQSFHDAVAQSKMIDYISDESMFTGMNGDLMKALVLYFMSSESMISVLINKPNIAKHFPVRVVISKLKKDWRQFIKYDFLDSTYESIAACFDQEIMAISSADPADGNFTKKEFALKRILSDLIGILDTNHRGYFDFSSTSVRAIWCFKMLIKLVECIDKYSCMKSQQKQKISRELQFPSLVKSFCSSLNNIVSDSSYSIKHGKELVQFLNSLEKLQFPEDRIGVWKQMMEQTMKKLLSKHWIDDKQFFEFYVKSIMDLELEEVLKNVMEEKAFAIMEESLKNQSFTEKLQYVIHSRISSENYTFASKMTKFLDKIFTSEWDKVAMKHNHNGGDLSQEMAVDLLSQSQFMSKYIRILAENKMECSKNIAPKFDRLKSLCETIAMNFGTGNLKIMTLTKILKSKKAFLDVFNLTHVSHGVRFDWERIFEIREIEYSLCETFIEKINVFQTLVSKCENLPVLDKFPLNEESIGSCKLIQFIEIADGQTTGQLSPLPWISSQQLDEVFSLRNSKVALEIWKNQCKSIQVGEESEEEHDTNIDIVKDVWEPTREQIIELIANIVTGSIKVCQAANIFKLAGDVTQELEILQNFYEFSNAGKDLSFENVKDPIMQIEAVLRNDKLMTSANVLNDVVKLLEIDSFEEIQCMMALNADIEKELKSIPADIADKQISLENVESDVIEILRSFVKQEPLVEFFMSMTDFQEVQVMCDMAMISAGENAMNVDRVSTLLNIATAFGPLLFDLDATSFEDLIGICNHVHDNYKRDSDLLKKWDDCASQLDWFKEIKDLKGSAESETIKLAKKINEKGHYKIKNCESGDWQQAISLTIITESKEEISLDKVIDLRDKLMLIANADDEKQKDVKFFVDLFSCVERLTKSYLSLLNEGCLLFHNWMAEIWYSEMEEDDVMQQNVCIQISFDEKMKRIKTDGNIGLLSSLDEIFRESLKTWKEFIGNLRTEYYLINYFTIKQITYLCKELAIWRTKIPDQVFVLLSSLFPNVTQQDLRDTMSVVATLKNIRGTIVFAENPLLKYNTGDNQVKLSEEATEIDKKMKAVSELMREQSVSAKVAKAAIQCEGHDDMDNCILWVLDNQNDDRLVNRLSQEFDNETQFDSKKLANVQINTNIFEGSTELTLKSVIEKLQTTSEKNSINFLSSVKTIIFGFCSQATAISLQDFLSFDGFGKILNALYTRLHQNASKRTIPIAGFEHGRPNLIKCSDKTMLSTVLSLYSLCPDQPLPTSAEVLICSSLTSCNDMEEFMRRAMCAKEENVHCMVFSERLSFNVAVFVEELYLKLSKLTQCNKKYQLIILSSSGQHYLAGCFEKYNIEARVLQDKQTLQKYLNHHLKAHNSDGFLEVDAFNVKVVSSIHSGVGKSLFIKRLRDKGKQKLFQKTTLHHCTTLRLVEKVADATQVIRTLYEQNQIQDHKAPNMVHIDISPAVTENIFELLFNLVILGAIVDRHGTVWRKHEMHVYMLEITLEHELDDENCHELLQVLPNVTCGMPKESLVENPDQNTLNKMDEIVFQSENIQRPYQYLAAYYNPQVNLDNFSYVKPKGTPEECLRTLLKYYPLQNPTWSQIVHFANFLNVHLKDCESSTFCNRNIIGNDLDGLKHMVVTSIINMAQDFCTPSLDLSDESFSDAARAINDEEFQRHQLRRRWEQDSHPYIFFNHDGHSMSFLNFVVDRNRGIIFDKVGKEIGRMPNKQIATNLMVNKVNLNMDLDQLQRNDKLDVLCNVMGVEPMFDPDPTFELTSDNVLKMLAIHMRFRSEIPVVIIGETGCGKTRMMEFLSKLLAGPNNNEKRMFTLKIHGGITSEDIYDTAFTVSEHCRNLANQEKPVILFFDEANTTEAIYAIKELVCDNTRNGLAIISSNLRFVAACNPYKKLSDAAIKNLKDSGLGYRIKEDETKNKLGNIAMRKLVYRVVALPPSIQPLAWDFGQLKSDAEKKYIDQMCMKLSTKLKLKPNETKLISNMISESQQFMRDQKDECHYVSMRDIERCMKTYEWFHNVVTDEFTEKLENEEEKKITKMAKFVRCLLQSMNICYYVSLHNRDAYLRMLSDNCKRNQIPLSPRGVKMEFSHFQEVFLKDLRRGDNVALNDALKENVFVMTVCIDNRIPLFVIGKPGSSKSLAKTIVGDNMQGNTSPSTMYRLLKRSHIISFQCSPLTDAVGIEAVFTQCIQLQAEQNLKNYTSVAVLDEIGLAEDSPKMPLKVLHPLLETGKIKDSSLSDPNTHEKVAFIGISNWALDPAKMNRGIFVTRKKPKQKDLMETAKAIFKPELYQANRKIIRAVTGTYEDIYKEQEVEYFGLRDYYSLVKMIYALSSEGSKISFKTICKAVQRNFSGGKTDLVPKFQEALEKIFGDEDVEQLSTSSLIKENIDAGADRFLLLLTTQYNAVYFLDTFLERDFEVIFGSSFPGDHNYTEVYRNINRIKACMENGRMVVLLNLTDLYESLYDALNQHYVTFGGQKYVDIGLGGHRVKCRVHKDFRLIVIEDKDVVYDFFPIPLINRLEKHALDCKSLLDEDQMNIASDLEEWSEEFVDENDFSEADAFVGFHPDMVYSLALFHDDLDECQNVLLQSATVDAVFRKFHHTKDRELLKEYMENQVHDKFTELLSKTFDEKWDSNIKMIEVKSFSQLLNNEDRLSLETSLEMDRNSVMLLTLQQFKTEMEFTDKVKQFRLRCDSGLNKSVLIVQCQSTELYMSLYESAKYVVTNLFGRNGFQDQRVVIAFVALTNRLTTPDAKMVLPLTKKWPSLYIDQLKISSVGFNSFLTCFSSSLYETLNHWREADIFVKLVQESLADAMVMIEDKEENKIRALERIKILSSIIDSADDNPFRQALFDKILHLTEQREANFSKKCKNWAYDVAKCERTLNENGVYQRALLVHLKKHVAKTLAYIVSLCDSLSNLNFIEHGGDWEKQLWLDIFHCNIFNSITWEKRQEDLHAFKPDQPDMYLAKKSSKFPFMFSIFKEIEEKCTPFLTEADQTLNAIASACLNGMEKTSNILQSATRHGGVEPIKSYAVDFMSLKWQDDKLHSIFTNIVMVHLQENNVDDNWGVEDLVKVHLVYRQLQDDFNLLHQIFAVFPKLLAEFENHLTDENRRNMKDVIDVALSLALHSLSQDVANINNNDVCNGWSVTMHKMGIIIDQIFTNIPDNLNTTRQKLWSELHFIYSFIHTLVPSYKNKMQFLKVVSSQAKMLWVGSRKSDLKSEKFVRIITNSLKKCLTEIESLMLTSWDTTDCCSCDGKLNNPVYFPCKHYFCKKHQATVGVTCPYCEEKHKKDDLKECVFSAEDQTQFKSFKSSCTSFFLDFVFENVFGNIPEKQRKHQTIVKSQDFVLQNLISVIDKNIGKSELKLEFLDWNQNTFVVVLQRLVQYYEHENCEKLQHILTSTKSVSLKKALISSFESTLHKTCPKTSNKAFGRLVQLYLGNKSCEQLGSLQAVAHIRYLLHLYVSRHQNILVLHPKSMTDFDIGIIKEFESNKNNENFTCIAEYLVKLGCHFHGEQWFQDLLKNKHLKALVPKSLQAELAADLTDYFTVLGDNYLLLKKDLYKCEDHKAIAEKFLPGADVETTTIKHLLLFQWAMSDKKKFHERMQLLGTFNLGNLNVPNLQRLLSGNFWDFIQANEFQNKALKELLILILLIINSSQNSILNEFKVMLQQPNNMLQKYLPGMPLSRYFQIPEDLIHSNSYAHSQNHVYRCPNGHIYTIGNCGRPTTQSICKEPGCGRGIGGISYRLVDGNQNTTVDEKSQAGYLLNQALTPDMEPAVERLSQSPESATIMQFMLHGTLLLTSVENEGRVRTLLKSNTNPCQSLARKLLENLQQIGRQLNKNVNDSAIFLYSFFGSLLCCNIPSQHNWSTMKTRESWEKQFGLEIIRPKVQHLDATLPEFKTIIKNANAECNVHLLSLLNENNKDENGKLWMYRVVPNNASFQRYFINQDNVQNSVMHIITGYGNKLAMLKYLESFVQMQQHLIERYNFQLDLTAAEGLTFQRYLDENDSKFEETIDDYLRIWNKLSARIFATANPKPPKKIMKLTMGSSIMTAMPNNRGIGKFAKLFIENFINLNNEFLIKCKPVVKEEFGEIGEVNVDQLLPAHVCVVDEEVDLKPIVDMHTIYRINRTKEGTQHCLEYNLDAIEKSVKLKFVLYKRTINVESLPQITYPQEMESNLLFDEIATKQRPLPLLLVQEVDNSVLHSSLQEICEAVNTTILVVHFINKVAHDQKKPLHAYLEEDLLLSSSRYEAIPKSSELQDTFALHQRLSWHRSIKFALADKNPFEDVLDDGNQEELTEDLNEKLNEFLANTNVKDFQRNLNEVIIKAGLHGDMHLDWSLADDIIPDLEVMCNVLDEEGEWYDGLPNDLLFKHVLDVFKTAVLYRKHE